MDFGLSDVKYLAIYLDFVSGIVERQGRELEFVHVDTTRSIDSIMSRMEEREQYQHL